jgi:dihydroorotate dehydrogenase
MYKVLRNFLFLFPPEPVHHFSMTCLRLLCGWRLTRKLIEKICTPPGKSKMARIGSLEFRNAVGLAAGFDKNAKYLRELQALGFGFAEIGTVTPLAQTGNPKPRLFRLPKDKALINRMGFNNDGVDAVVARLKNWRSKQAANVYSTTSKMKIGGNIGKNKTTPNEDAWKDYETCFIALHPYVDYFVVNVSSPNTPGLRELQEKDSLRKILLRLQELNNQQQVAKPVFLKIAPDLTHEQVDDVIDLALEIQLDGLVAANTTIARTGLKTSVEKVEKMGAGGLSGLPLRDRATELVSHIVKKSKGVIPVMASGGIFTGADAKEKLDAGAQVVQVWTGFIYQGPLIVKQVLKYLHQTSPETGVGNPVE